MRHGFTLALLTAGLGTVLLSATATAQDDDGEAVSHRMVRNIGVMEKIIDQVLLDSPNFLVPGRENTRGLYLDEFGVLLTFEASLVKDGDWDFEFDMPGDFRIETDEDGRKIIIIPEGTDRRDEKDEDGDDSRRTWRDRQRSREARVYERGKREIIDVLLDYGDTMTALRDGQWVAVAAFLKDADYFLENRISRLIIKARIDDLRDYAAGRIDEETMVGRFVEEEY